MIARRYHDRTAHSAASVRLSTHVLDWDVKPFPFKVYSELPALVLPRELDPLGVDALSALAGLPPAGAELRLPDLAALLYYAAGITRKKTYPGGGEVLFRAAPSTGALYQTEVYVVAGAVAGLEPGLYHFCPGDFALRRLRDGDVRATLATAAADPAVAQRAATIALTGIYWRNTWKYQARGWRHLFWDSGTMLANLLAAGGALGQAPRLLTGFADAAVNHLLGVDPAREATLELVTLGARTADARDGTEPLPLAHPCVPLSSTEVDYPLLREIQEATSLFDADAVRAWRTAAATWRPPARRSAERPALPLPVPRPASGRGLGATIQRRASTRQFGHDPITAEELATALWAATRGVDTDAPTGLVELYLVINAVTDVPAGAYRYEPEAHALETLKLGDFRRESAYLCLEQALGGDAAAVIYFLAPLDGLLASLGERGYRLANLEAGLAGGRAYLAAYALGFGATGLTFYDRDVVDFFKPRAAGSDAIFVTALGRSAREPRATIGQTVTPVRGLLR